MQLLRNTNNRIEVKDVTDVSELDKDISEGWYVDKTLQPKDAYLFRNPETQDVHVVPHSEAAEAQANGYTLLNHDEVTKHATKKAVKTMGTAQAFGRAALKGVTFGLAQIPVAGIPESVDARTISETIEEEYPIASLTGEIAGGLLVPVPGANVAKGVATVASKVAPKIAANVAGKVAAKIAETSVASAVDAGLYAGGSLIGEATFNASHGISNDFVTENAANDILNTAIGGAVVGGAIPLAGVGLSLLPKGFSKAFTSAHKWFLPEDAPERKLIDDVFQSPEQRAAIFGHGPGSLNNELKGLEEQILELKTKKQGVVEDLRFSSSNSHKEIFSQHKAENKAKYTEHKQKILDTQDSKLAELEKTRDEIKANIHEYNTVSKMEPQALRNRVTQDIFNAAKLKEEELLKDVGSRLDNPQGLSEVNNEVLQSGVRDVLKKIDELSDPELYEQSIVKKIRRDALEPLQQVEDTSRRRATVLEQEAEVSAKLLNLLKNNNPSAARKALEVGQPLRDEIQEAMTRKAIYDAAGVLPTGTQAFIHPDGKWRRARFTKDIDQQQVGLISPFPTLLKQLDPRNDSNLILFEGDNRWYFKHELPDTKLEIRGKPAHVVSLDSETYLKKIRDADMEVHPNSSGELGPMELPTFEEGALSQTPAQTAYDKLRKARQEIDKYAKWGQAASAKDKDTVTLVRKLRDDLKKLIEDPQIFGANASSIIRKANDDYSAYKNARKAFVKKFGERVETPSGPKYVLSKKKVGAFLKHVDDPLRTQEKEVFDAFLEKTLGIGKGEDVRKVVISYAELVNKKGTIELQKANLADEKRKILGLARDELKKLETARAQTVDESTKVYDKTRQEKADLKKSWVEYGENLSKYEQKLAADKAILKAYQTEINQAKSSRTGDVLGTVGGIMGATGEVLGGGVTGGVGGAVLGKAVGKAFDLMNNPIAAAEAIYKIQQSGPYKVLKRLEEGVANWSDKRYVRQGLSATKRVAINRALLADADKHQEAMDQAISAVLDPSAENPLPSTADTIEADAKLQHVRNTAGAYVEAVPEASKRIAEWFAKGKEVLNQYRPKQVSGVEYDAGLRKRRFTETEASRYSEAYRAVTDPLSILDRPSAVGVRVLMSLYPGSMDVFRAKILEAIANKRVPADKIQEIKRILGLVNNYQQFYEKPEYKQANVKTEVF
jgi:hypothetical protein